MTGTWWTKVLLFSTMMLAGSILAFHAKGGMNKDRPGVSRGQKIEQMADHLELNQDQVDRIDDLRYEMKKKSIDMHADLEKARLELQRLMDADDLNRKAIISQVENVNELEDKLGILKIENMLDVSDVLTFEQRKMAKDLRQSKRMGSKVSRQGKFNNEEKNHQHEEGMRHGMDMKEMPRDLPASKAK
ncbi:periplasmic heavy metal sensor [bacterium]|nr:periplasmic heavy metal sensor [bacterium]